MRKNRDALALAAAFPLAFAFPVVAQTQPQPATPAAADARVKSLGIVTIIKENAGCVTVAGDTLGKQQPNIPKWRATSLASYRFDEHWRASLVARYSGAQFPTLNNADVNGYTYQGVSEYFTTDVRVRYAMGKQWTASFGIDNLNNYAYWNFHPYPQRSCMTELQFDL